MKIYIFLKTLSSSHFQSNQALNQPWALEFQHRWGTGGLSHKGYKMWCLKMPLFWFVSSANGNKRIRDNVLFWRMAQAQPMHTTNNTCTWGRMSLHRVAWDSYVRSATFVTWEMSNDRFTIPELVLPIVRKRHVTHYQRVTKRKNKHGQWSQASTKQNKLLLRAKSLYIYIYIYIYMVSI